MSVTHSPGESAVHYSLTVLPRIIEQAICHHAQHTRRRLNVDAHNVDEQRASFGRPVHYEMKTLLAPCPKIGRKIMLVDLEDNEKEKRVFKENDDHSREEERGRDLEGVAQ